MHVYVDIGDASSSLRGSTSSSFMIFVADGCLLSYLQRAAHSCVPRSLRSAQETGRDPRPLLAGLVVVSLH